MSAVNFGMVIASGLLIALAASFEFCFRAGRRHAREEDARTSSTIGAIQGALLGLLGLLLAFSFAAAGARFLERQDLIVAEANAIGTATLRADLLGPDDARRLREALRDYTHHRIEASKNLAEGLAATTEMEIIALQARLWSAAIQGVQNHRDTMLAVLNPVNEVIDLHSTRVAAGRKHTPALVLGLLVTCCLVSIGVIGYGCGVSGNRRPEMTFSLIFLIWAALWITIDLDYPRAGLLRLSDAPLQALKFDAPPATPPPGEPARP